jgi:hypothetical protein
MRACGCGVHDDYHRLSSDEARAAFEHHALDELVASIGGLDAIASILAKRGMNEAVARCRLDVSLSVALFTSASYELPCSSTTAVRRWILLGTGGSTIARPRPWSSSRIALLLPLPLALIFLCPLLIPLLSDLLLHVMLLCFFVRLLVEAPRLLALLILLLLLLVHLVVLVHLFVLLHSVSRIQLLPLLVKLHPVLRIQLRPLIVYRVVHLHLPMLVHSFFHFLVRLSLRLLLRLRLRLLVIGLLLQTLLLVPRLHATLYPSTSSLPTPLLSLVLVPIPSARVPRSSPERIPPRPTSSPALDKAPRTQ